jgi:hypothetical protein
VNPGAKRRKLINIYLFQLHMAEGVSAQTLLNMAFSQLVRKIRFVLSTNHATGRGEIFTLIGCVRRPFVRPRIESTTGLRLAANANGEAAQCGARRAMKLGSGAGEGRRSKNSMKACQNREPFWISRLFPKHSPPVLLAHFFGDAGPRQPHELGERSGDKRFGMLEGFSLGRGRLAAAAKVDCGFIRCRFEPTGDKVTAIR